MTVDLSVIETITQLAEQFGPFLFAVLFILVVTRTAQGYYKECATREHPPASDQEVRTYRLYFLCSVWVGIAVMGLSLGWWFYVQAKGSHVYQVAIVDLTPDQTVLSEYYNKLVPHPSVPGAQPAHDLFFLVVRDQPFKVGEKFSFEYFKLDSAAAGTGITGKRVEITYGGHSQDKFQLIADAAGPRLELVAQDTSRPTQFFTAAEVKTAIPYYVNVAELSRGVGQ
jgi:hypothetical protein